MIEYPNVIDSFTGDYFFLSNFYSCKVPFDGLVYSSSETAFQLQKVNRVLQRMHKDEKPSEAKRIGRSCKLPIDWDEKKDKIMYEIVKAKFTYNEDIQKKLLDTGESKLVEGNTWGDKYWGQVQGIGENKLGKILMKVRSELRIEKEMRKSL